MDYTICGICGCVTARPEAHEDWHRGFDDLEEGLDTVAADVVELKKTKADKIIEVKL